MSDQIPAPRGPSEPMPELQLSAPRLAVPGQPAVLSLAVRNAASGPRRLRVALVGVDPAWRGSPDATFALAAGASDVLSLQVIPPSGTAPGRYPFVVSVQPCDPQSGAALAAPAHLDGELRVGADPKLAAHLDPAEPRAVYRREVNLVVENTGPEPVALDVEWTQPPGVRIYTNDDRIAVPAGGTARVPASVEVSAARLVGRPRRVPLQVTASAPAIRIQAEGVFTARAVFGAGITKALALLVVVCLWAGAAVVAIDKIASSSHKAGLSNQRATATSSGSGSGGSSSSGGSGGSSSGSSGGSGGSGSGSSGSASAPGAVVLTGTVTGQGPGGVSVSLAPTSLVDEASQGANFLGNSGLAAYTTGYGKIPASAIGYQRPGSVSTPRSTQTAADGSFAFAGVQAPGYYLLTFSKPGYEVVKYVVQAVAGSPPAPLKVALTAGTGSLSGTVTGPGGAPLGGAQISITDGSVTASTSSATVGHVGTWQVDGLSTPGTYLVSASRTGYATESKLVTLAAGGSGSASLSLQAGVASLTGMITGPDNTGKDVGLGGLTVTATDASMSRSATTVTTGPVGAFTLANLPEPATYTVTISGAGYLTQTRQVKVVPTAPAPPVDALLTPSTGVVVGTITGAGAGLVGAGLTLTGPGGTFKAMSTSTPSAGGFDLTGIPPGAYTLTGQDFGFFDDSVAVTVGAGGVTTSTIKLTAEPSGGLAANAHIQVLVVDARTGAQLTCPLGASGCTNPPAVDITVKSNGATVWPSSPTSLASNQTNTVPPTNGPGLLPGLYQVTASAPEAGYQSNTVTVSVASGQTVLAPTIGLQPLAVLAGTVSAAVGQVPNGTCVAAVPVAAVLLSGYRPSGCNPSPTCTVTPSVGGNSGCEAVASDGTYSIPMPTGAYFIYVLLPSSASDYLSPTPSYFQLTAGNTARYDVTLNRLGQVDLSVYTPGGNGNAVVAPNATVTCSGGPCDQASATTGTNGVASFTGLQPGTTYTFTAQVPGVTQTASVQLQPGLNQTLQASVVVAGAAQYVVGQVVTDVDGKPKAVSGASVSIAAVTGYNGALAVTSTINVTSDSGGCFAILSPSLGGVLPALPSGLGTCASATDLATSPYGVTQSILAPQVTVSASASGYPNLGATQATAQSQQLMTVVLESPATKISGCLAFASQTDPSPSTCTVPGGFDPNKLVATVTQTAAGAGNVVVTADKSGQLIWNDPTQPAVGDAHPGTYVLQIAYPGYDTTTTQPFTVPLQSSGTGYTITPPIVVNPLGTLVLSSVDGTDPSNPPVNGATFVLSGKGVATTSATAPPGTNQVTFPGLAAGTYSLTVQAAGYQLPSSPAPIQVTDGPADDTQTVALSELGEFSGTVNGTVGSGGNTQSTPLVGATVTATDNSSGTKFTTTTGSDGTYYLTGTAAHAGLDASHTFTLEVTAPGYATYSNTSATPVLPYNDPNHDQTNPSLAASTVCLVVDVTDNNSPPGAVSTATVAVRSASLGVDQTATANTDCSGTAASGSYEVSGIQPAQYTVSVTAAGYQPLSMQVTLQPGTAQPTVSAVLAVQTGEVTGQVTGQTGVLPPAAVSGASVQLYDTSNTAVGSAVTTDGNGNFTLPGLQAGSYYVKVTPAGGSSYAAGQSQTFTVASGQVQQVNVTLYAALASVQVTVTSGGATGGSEVSLVATSGGGGQSQAGQATTGTGTSTSTTFNQVVPGTYDVVSRAPDGHVAGYANGISVAASSTTQKVTVTEEDLQVSVATTPAGASPVASVAVAATDGSANLSGTTSGTSSNTVDFLVPWQVGYQVNVSASGYTNGTATVAAQKSAAASAAASVTLSAFGALSVSASGGTAGKTYTVTATGSSGVSATADTDGTTPAVIPGLPPDKYTVTVTQAPKTGSASATVSAGGTTSVSVTVK